MAWFISTRNLLTIFLRLLIFMFKSTFDSTFCSRPFNGEYSLSATYLVSLNYSQTPFIRNACKRPDIANLLSQCKDIEERIHRRQSVDSEGTTLIHTRRGHWTGPQCTFLLDGGVSGHRIDAQVCWCFIWDLNNIEADGSRTKVRIFVISFQTLVF